MNSTDASGIHRYLDEAFARVAMTPELQDLKEEIRGNLVARVDELTEGGAPAASAASAAVAELGDIRELIDSLAQERPAPHSRTQQQHVDAHRLNRVRPKPAFVIRTVVFSLVLAAGALVVACGFADLIDAPALTMGILAALGVATPAGLLVADSLRQETTQRYPVPRRRAVPFGAATAAGLFGLWMVGLAWKLGWPPAWLVAGVLLTLAAVIALVWLGVTQTNRTKPWVLAIERDHEFEDGFSRDPVAAARFGVYTIVIWILAFGLFVVASMTIGFAWSWLALLLGLAVFMLVLARMLFAADPKERR